MSMKTKDSCCLFTWSKIHSWLVKKRERCKFKHKERCSVKHMLSHEEAAQRDRAVRLHSVHTDIELDLPPSIALPDGEEIPYGSGTRLHIRDPEQESEIYQKCIRPPPNRTVFDGESPPPYRSCSAGLLSLGSDWSSSTSSGVVRCHSMSSSTANNPPAVIVPTRLRRLSTFGDARDTGGGSRGKGGNSTTSSSTLANLTMVPCKAEGRNSSRR